MVNYVLDASAVIRYLDGEAGADRVALLLTEHLAGRCRASISAVNWGEIAGIICKAHGRGAVESALAPLRSLGLEIVPVTAERAERAGVLRAVHKIPYADAFGVELASDSPDHILITADFDVKPAEKRVQIEFLPTK